MMQVIPAAGVNEISKTLPLLVASKMGAPTLKAEASVKLDRFVEKVALQ